MTTVDIEYCVPCGHLDRAQDLQRAILQALGREIEAVTLRTGTGGVFRVDVDGETIFDIAEDEFDIDRIVRDVRQRS
ncbi:selenoprotein W-related protein [Natronoarchaeum philippinense]|uniref:Selenoprotein W-related protein n=1 Tax=Natronoarchaeum philippinense TaxID=558529 RepID=A0A285P0L8_NATPI|nr:Rdx family protein [Natronoarchaeum philippinense]SNZ13421.1 selenoprotein W-related protein [Natronoarchaeum philippinense]